MAFWLLLLFLFVTNNNAKQPNIIFIISDDLGHDDLSYSTSHQVKTPNLAKFRSEARGLKWYYGQPNCSPTRSSIITGMYSIHTGINSIIQPTDNYGTPLKYKFISNMLFQNNYNTHAIGKWHLGDFKWCYTPTYRGFESFYGYYGGGEDYYTHEAGGAYDFREDIGVKCGPNCSRVATEAHGKYSAHLFTNRAIQIIEQHNKTKPLFLWLAYQSVHAPTEVPQSYINAYNGIIQDAKRKKYAAMVSCMDEGIGNITKTLQDLGYLDENTIIVFTSDNGGPVISPYDNSGGNTGACNWPLRGGKRTVWEGGTRLTSFIWTTDDIISDKNLRGGNYSQLMHISDWYPTLIEGAAGISLSKLNYSLDGVNQWNGIIGKENTSKDEYFYFRDYIYYDHNIENHKPSNNSAYRKRWNKIFNGTGGGNPDENGWVKPPGVAVMYDNDNVTNMMPLYNISNDPYEYNDISANYSDLVQQLYSEMEQIFKSAPYYPHPPVDNSCPKVTHPNNSVVGPVWQPWCGEY
eukprot:184180_1